jgi:hypothetical protein
MDLGLMDRPIPKPHSRHSLSLPPTTRTVPPPQPPQLSDFPSDRDRFDSPDRAILSISDKRASRRPSTVDDGKTLIQRLTLTGLPTNKLTLNLWNNVARVTLLRNRGVGRDGLPRANDRTGHCGRRLVRPPEVRRPRIQDTGGLG